MKKNFLSLLCVFSVGQMLSMDKADDVYSECMRSCLIYNVKYNFSGDESAYQKFYDDRMKVKSFLTDEDVEMVRRSVQTTIDRESRYLRESTNSAVMGAVVPAAVISGVCYFRGDSFDVNPRDLESVDYCPQEDAPTLWSQFFQVGPMVLQGAMQVGNVLSSARSALRHRGKVKELTGFLDGLKRVEDDRAQRLELEAQEQEEERIKALNYMILRDEDKKRKKLKRKKGRTNKR